MSNKHAVNENPDDFEEGYSQVFAPGKNSASANMSDRQHNLTLMELGQNPGEMLKSAREKMGLSLAEISVETKINERQLLAIESGITSRLPPETFAKAFVKSYCKVVHVDPEPVLKAFGFEAGVSAPVVIPPSIVASSNGTDEAPPPPNHLRTSPPIYFEKRPWKKNVGIAVGVAIVAGAAAFYIPAFLDGHRQENLQDALSMKMPSDGSSGQNEADAQGGSLPDGSDSSVAGIQDPATMVAQGGEAAMTEPSADGANAQVSGENNSVFPAIAAENRKAREIQALADAQEAARLAAQNGGVGANAVGASADSAANGRSNASSSAVAPAVPAAGKPLTASGESVLSFSFSDQSWVTVRDASGQVLLSQANNAGSNIQLKGKAPFKLIVSNAPKVRLTVNGKPVALKGAGSGNVARMAVQ